MEELAKTYNPKETEGRIYNLWEKEKVFEPKIDPEQKPFTIVIPPPNVTGSLHMGHALNNTIQDILIRQKRMQGVPALWVPGTDHAGIATQNVVEKNLAKKGIKKQDLSREEFTAEIEKWVEEYGHTIIDQLKQMGCSCDWSRQRYTMDTDYKEAVNIAFKHYFDKGLIYQADRVINWCTRCQTSLSDIEVEYKPQKATLYYFKYDADFPITIATVRPETKLGDTAVAVNPNDKRYQEFIGKEYEINFCGVKRTIKIIADEMVDKKFGTGALGVTPAHSIADSELAEKNGLKSITIIDKYGKITPQGGDLAGLKVAEAREKVVEWLKKENLLVKSEEIENNLSVCYRCGKEIEPQPSRQWFLRMKELIKPAIEVIKNDEIKLTPTRWKKVYLDWMENIRDWCISRQIIWGHKIPVEGETDVLDTWFSSALWPIAVFLKKNSSKSNLKNQNAKLRKTIDIFGEDLVSDDLSYFYPTSILSTARDINMLWVVRMIFSGFEFMKEKPFSKVYIHPTVFNKEGKRMSKSLGTGVDPLELIDKYGADATRFGLAYINTGIQDIKFDENAILAGQKFANKIWNIARFIMININEASSETKSGSQAPQEGAPATAPVERTSFCDERTIKPRTEADKKILNSLNSLVSSINSDLDNFRFGQAAHNLYDFIWHDFADTYIEKCKSQNANLKMKENTKDILLYVLATSLKLLHPFMPFVTEEIWQNLKKQDLVEEKMLILTKWPDQA